MAAGHLGLRLPADQIGGAHVVRAFNAGGERIRTGTVLTGDYIRNIPTANRNCLIDKHYIAVWPKSGDAVSPPVSSGTGQRPERHVVTLGFGHFAVIEGSVVNDKPLTREEAYALAGKPAPEKVNRRRKSAQAA
jgi:hypothetical protein